MNERAAFASLAVALRRHSHNYRQWAREETDPVKRAKWNGEADRCRSNAHWYLAKAKDRLPDMTGGIDV